MKKKRSPSNQSYKAVFNIIPIYNLEEGMPFVDSAKVKLSGIIETEKRRGTNKAIKIIHGWGSSGVGGKLRPGLRTYLRTEIEKARIKDFIPGEEFSSFNNKMPEILYKYPRLSEDSDFGGKNPGVTIILL